MSKFKVELELETAPPAKAPPQQQHTDPYEELHEDVDYAIYQLELGENEAKALRYLDQVHQQLCLRADKLPKEWVLDLKKQVEGALRNFSPNRNWQKRTIEQE